MPQLLVTCAVFASPAPRVSALLPADELYQDRLVEPVGPDETGADLTLAHAALVGRQPWLFTAVRAASYLPAIGHVLGSLHGFRPALSCFMAKHETLPRTDLFALTLSEVTARPPPA